MDKRSKLQRTLRSDGAVGGDGNEVEEKLSIEGMEAVSEEFRKAEK